MGARTDARPPGGTRSLSKWSWAAGAGGPDLTGSQQATCQVSAQCRGVVSSGAPLGCVQSRVKAFWTENSGRCMSDTVGKAKGPQSWSRQGPSTDGRMVPGGESLGASGTRRQAPSRPPAGADSRSRAELLIQVPSIHGSRHSRGLGLAQRARIRGRFRQGPGVCPLALSWCQGSHTCAASQVPPAMSLSPKSCSCNTSLLQGSYSLPVCVEDVGASPRCLLPGTRAYGERRRPARGQRWEEGRPLALLPRPLSRDQQALPVTAGCSPSSTSVQGGGLALRLGQRAPVGLEG